MQYAMFFSSHKYGNIELPECQNKFRIIISIKHDTELFKMINVLTQLAWEMFEYYVKKQR